MIVRTLGLLSGSQRDVEPEQVAEMIAVLAEHYYVNRKGLSMKGVKGAPDWLGYESALWQLSERVREYLRGRKDLRGKNQVLDASAMLVSDARLGKGRQNFVLLLGEFGGLVYSDAIRQALLDADISGHAVKAALRAKMPGMDDAVRRVSAQTAQSWVKSACRRYLATSADVSTIDGGNR
jgi:hypothetical protein